MCLLLDRMGNYQIVSVYASSELNVLYLLVRRCNDRKKRGLIFHVDNKVELARVIVDMVVKN